jgi:hypothetical protein
MSESFSKGMILPVDGMGSPVIFQFNPQAVQGPTAQLEYAQINVVGRQYPYLQYSNGKPGEIRVQLQFAGQHDGGASVASAYYALESLTTPSPLNIGLAFGSMMSRPPRVMFIMGDFLRELAVVVNLSPNFTIGRGGDFRGSLMPMMATIDVTLWRWRG